MKSTAAQNLANPKSSPTTTTTTTTEMINCSQSQAAIIETTSSAMVRNLNISFKGSHHHRSHSEVCYRRRNELDFPSRDVQVLSNDDHFCDYMDLEKVATTKTTTASTNRQPPAVQPVAVGNNNSNSLINPDTPDSDPLMVVQTTTGERSASRSTKDILMRLPSHRHCSVVSSVDDDGISSSRLKRNGKGRSSSSRAAAARAAWDRKRAMDLKLRPELFAANPKRAKRILANRQSAARSTARKARYVLELEQKITTLQTKARILGTRLKLIQNDTAVLSKENTVLNLHLHALEQRAQLRNDLSEELKKNIDWLKRANGEYLGRGNGGLEPYSFLSLAVNPSQAHSGVPSEMVKQEPLDRMHGFDYSSGDSRVSQPDMSSEDSSESASEGSNTTF